MSKWLDFEKMIAQIYSTISPNATVTHNDSIHGLDSGISRQIDVSVKFREAGCNFLIIIQAKTNTRPLDVNTVGEFATVIKDVRASKGVLICNAGFSKSAQDLANSLGIELCSAHDAKNKDWSTTLRLPVILIQLQPKLKTQVTMKLEAGDSLSKNFSEWKFRLKPEKNVFSLIDFFTKKWNANEISKEPNKEHLIDLENYECELFAGKGWRSISDLKLYYFITRQLFRNELEISEFTGLKSQLTGKLEIADLKIDVPPRITKHGWVELSEEEAKFMSCENTIVTVDDPIFLQAPPEEQELSIREIL
ncbi:MAG: restriction endonuclease [bacterium]|nr:restriction endonuclease [bacterium]